MAQTHPSQKADRMPGEHQRGIIRHIAIQVPYYDAEAVQSAPPVDCEIVVGPKPEPSTESEPDDAERS
jgi:hypothetical protein